MQGTADARDNNGFNIGDASSPGQYLSGYTAQRLREVMPKFPKLARFIRALKPINLEEMSFSSQR